MQKVFTTYDPLYGFISLTETEKKIIQSPFYQRLRWIRQLGFSNYIFPGAEHNRFAHALGVMHMADRMIRSIGKDVPNEKLFNVKAKDANTMFHKSVRMAALLHDIGTFPFSHTTEAAYIRHGDSSFKKQERGKDLPNNHEHLGAFILKNTNFENGITQILKNDGYDTSEISKIVKGQSSNLLANQLLHAEVDADRCDYLMRDAHYTGLKYGQFDREYILYHLTTVTAGGKEIVAIKEKALHAVEDFLIARFGWYSQIVRATEGAKFDIIAAAVTKHLLEKKLLPQFQDLLKMAETSPEEFYGFNDMYFMTLIHKAHMEQSIKDIKIAEMIKMLLFRISPITINLPHLEESLIERINGETKKREILIKKIEETVASFENTIKEFGDGSEWILYDIPKSDITFAKSIENVMRDRVHDNVLQERDPVKVVDKHGKTTLLIERENSIIRILSNLANFIPSVYVNESAYTLLEKKGLLKKANVKKK